MAYDNSNAYGKAYSFGLKSADAPTIPHFFARSAELRYEPETFNEAKDSQGITMFVTTVQSSKRKISATITGYIDTDFDPYVEAFPLGFTFKGKFYVINNVSHPMPKGNFNEVAIEGIHYNYITT